MADDLHSQALRLAEEAGHEDLESAGDPDGLLSDRGNYNKEIDPTAEEYFSFLNEQLTYKFKNDRDRNIWAGYARGDSAHEIARQHGYDRERLFERFKKLLAIVGDAQRAENDKTPPIRNMIETCDPSVLIEILSRLNNE